MDTNPDKVLYVIRGLPGSGKTTLARHLTRWEITADDYHQLYNEKGVLIYPELIPLAYQWCQSRVEFFMQLKLVTLAVHNTFTQKIFIQPYIELADKYGYEVQVVECKGAHGSIPNVPEEVMQRMRDTWEEWA